MSTNGKGFWGPATWKTIHMIAAAYTPRDAQTFTRFVYALQALLPCDICRRHLAENLKLLPPRTKSQEDAFAWSVELHNTVNTQLNKPTISLAQAKRMYTGPKARCQWNGDMWRFIHSVAAAYTINNADAFRDMMKAVMDLVPCSAEFRDLVRRVPPDVYLSNNEDLFFWTYILRSYSRSSRITYDGLKREYSVLKKECKACRTGL